MPSRVRPVPVATLLATFLLSACASTAPPRRSAMQQSLGEKDGLSARELRLRLYEMPPQLGGILESAAEEIRGSSSDPAVRHRALLWEADGVPALYTAALRPDPLAGALDLWVLVYQMQDYFETGSGRVAFGAEQGVAVGALRRMVKLIDGVGESLTPDAASFRKRQAKVQEFARNHPVDGTFASRESAVTALARFTAGESGGALAGVGEATDTLADVSLRLNVYMTLLPRVARWQAALAAEDVTGRENLRATLDDLEAIAAAARRADGLLSDLPGTVRAASVPLGEFWNEQRPALLAAIDESRLALTAYVTAEREAALGALAAERQAAMQSLSAERTATMDQLEDLSRRSIDDVMGRARRMTDYIFWRALILIAAAALLLGLAYRLARRPRAGTANV